MRHSKSPKIFYILFSEKMRRPSFTFYIIFLSVLYLYNCLSIVLWAFLFSGLAAFLLRKYFYVKLLAIPSRNEKCAVLITGTSSGFGKLFTYKCIEKGLMVFACVRKQEDGEKLIRDAKSENRSLIKILILDVTKNEEISDGIKFVSETLNSTGYQLYAIVNNAGVSVTCPEETIALDKLRYQYNVNVFGAVAVTQAFLPFLFKFNLQYKPRIIFISSAAGLFVLPFLSVYSGSKYALEAIADGFRVELKNSNITVSIIEPGSFSTPIMKQANGTVYNSKGTTNPLLDKQYGGFKKLMQTFASSSILPDSTPVANLFESVLFSKFPPTRATIGIDAILAAPLVGWILPDSITDFIISKLCMKFFELI